MTLRLSCEGPEVVSFQVCLSSAGFDLTVTGKFDQKTKEATQAFQRLVGLEGHGEVDPKTWECLMSRYEAPTVLHRVLGIP